MSKNIYYSKNLVRILSENIIKLISVKILKLSIKLELVEVKLFFIIEQNYFWAVNSCINDRGGRLLKSKFYKLNSILLIKTVSKIIHHSNF